MIDKLYFIVQAAGAQRSTYIHDYLSIKTLSNNVDIPVLKRLMQMRQISHMGYQTTAPQQGE